MSLLGKTEDVLVELINLETKRIKDHERIIKIYPPNNPATVENQNLKAQAQIARNHYNVMLKTMERIRRECKSQVLFQCEEQFRQALLALNQCRNDRNKIGLAEQIINGIYNRAR